jgi:hypothetical protein
LIRGGARKPNPPLMMVIPVTAPPVIVEVNSALPNPKYIVAVVELFWKNKYALPALTGDTNCDAVPLTIVETNP